MIRKAGKVLGICFAGLVVLVLLLMLALKLALDQAPRYEAEIKEWVHAQTGYHIGFARVSPAFVGTVRSSISIAWNSAPRMISACWRAQREAGLPRIFGS
jgi:hypothetical protein